MYSAFLSNVKEFKILCWSVSTLVIRIFQKQQMFLDKKTSSCTLDSKERLYRIRDNCITVGQAYFSVHISSCCFLCEGEAESLDRFTTFNVDKPVREMTTLMNDVDLLMKLASCDLIATEHNCHLSSNKIPQPALLTH